MFFPCLFAALLYILGLPLLDQRFSFPKRVRKGIAFRQRFFKKSPAEISEFIVVGTAKGTAIMAISGNHQRAIIFDGIYKSAGIASRDKNDFPANSSLLNQRRQIFSR